MGAITSSQHERAEVDSLLESGLFDKAPRLGKFFRYICDRHFEGRADQIKEYSIAVEALGRSAEFDSKRDSIVRVEAHRLRKRLEEYYKGPGSRRPVQVVIPNGQYRPHFLFRQLEQETLPPAAPELPLVAADFQTVHVLEPPPRKARRLPWALLVSLLLVVSVSIPFFVQAEKASVKAKVAEKAGEVWTGSSTDPVQGEFRMLAGYHGPPTVDRQGHTWLPDAYYNGGTSIPIPPDHFIEGLPDPHLLKAQRSGTFQYAIPLAQGPHEVRLYFAETDFGRGNPLGGAEGTRTFQFTLNGETVETLLDPLAEAGTPNRLYERVMKDIAPSSDGKLHLGFAGVSGPATINAIEILPSTPGRIHPVRIVTQNTPVTDSDGRLWAADEYFNGGTLVFRRNVILDRPERALFQGERYGNFCYRIPLAPGKYKLTLHFVETWFGTSESSFAPLDSRAFDVIANGTALLREFQVGKDAGGPNRIVEKVFGNLHPNAQGVLVLEFLPIKNYAEVNALEVVETD